VVRRFIVPVAALALLMAAIFRVGIEKNMVGTFSGNDWGRYLFALGATLTKFRLGTGGYVIDSAIEGQLMLGGLNADPPTWPRLGAKYPDNWHDPELMQRALDRALHADIPPPTDDRLRGSHGDDVGLATFTALAFSLFGMKISSLYYTFFVLLGTSLLIFVITYRRSPVSLSCAILMLLALYTLCASDVVNLIQQVPPYRGGPGTEIKEVLAAIPALHVLLAWLLPVRRFSTTDYVALALQAAILAFAIHVRWPVLWVAPALLVYVAITIIVRRAWRELLPAGVFTTVLAVGIIAPTALAHPIYRIDADLLHHPLWHNMLTSLQYHPAWAERYLAGVNGAGGDDVPGIVAKQEIARLPAEERGQYFYRNLPGYPNPSAVNQFARKRFFDIAREDPQMVLETFLVILPRMLWAQIANYHTAHTAVVTMPVAAVILLGLAAAIWIAACDDFAPKALFRVALASFVLSVLAAAPILIGGAHEILMTDHFLWSFFTASAVFALPIIYVARLGIPQLAHSGI
jgi:hypothetical protein